MPTLSRSLAFHPPFGAPHSPPKSGTDERWCFTKSLSPPARRLDAGDSTSARHFPERACPCARSWALRTPRSRLPQAHVRVSDCLGVSGDAGTWVPSFRPAAVLGAAHALQQIRPLTLEPADGVQSPLSDELASVALLRRSVRSPCRPPITRFGLRSCSRLASLAHCGTGRRHLMPHASHRAPGAQM
jgi:hypothetical protein